MVSHLIWGRLEPLRSESSSEDGFSGDIRWRAANVEFHDESGTSGSQSEMHHNFSEDILNKNRGQGVSAPVQSPEAKAPAAIGEHSLGTCVPCLYFHSKVGCNNGQSCRYCHLRHEKKSRPCKAKRNQCKQILDVLTTAFDQDSREFHEASQRLSGESEYMRAIIAKAQRQRAKAIKNGTANAAASSSDKPLEAALRPYIHVDERQVPMRSVSSSSIPYSHQTSMFNQRM